MTKYDFYLYDDCNVLRNLLNIKNEGELDLAEAEISSVNMMLLYEKGFDDFSSAGICKIHKSLFGDIYDWAGEYRLINIMKREPLLAGKSVWYSDSDNIETDLEKIWTKIKAVDWCKLTKEEFVELVARLFPEIWQVHPFREGNTRTVVMLMTFFVEHYGYYFDQYLMKEFSAYVRNAFVLSCFGEHSEYGHLEKILSDAICTEPAKYDDEGDFEKSCNISKYEQYYVKDYKPTPHEYYGNQSES